MSPKAEIVEVTYVEDMLTVGKVGTIIAFPVTQFFVIVNVKVCVP
jgi:hypothetical protein